MKRNPLLLPVLAVALIGIALWMQVAPPGTAPAGDTPVSAAQPGPGLENRSNDWPAFLPAEARPVLRRIADGGPHPYRQDGSVFQNREGRLPAQPRGHYREYTVETPGLDHRGARRIVTGGRPPATYYYTDNHYGSFRRFDPPQDHRP